MPTKTLTEIFQGRIFRIPDYQRGYAWSDEHRQAFWDDLELLQQVSTDTHHYTGLIAIETIPVAEAKSKMPLPEQWMINGSNNLCLVVDGQQRLTTIIIFLHELLKRHNELRPELPFNETTRRADAESRYIRKENLYVPGSFGYTFGYLENQETDRFFRRTILDDINQIQQGESTSAYARQLLNAKNFFHKKFQAIAQPEALASWYNLIENRLLFNVFEINNEFDVCLTFEAMNNRGKPLSDLEKLKSRFLYLAGLIASKDNNQRFETLNQYRQIINDAWKKSYKLLGWNSGNILDDDELLQLVWILRYGRTEGNRGRHLFNEEFTPRRALDGDQWNIINSFSMALAELSAPWLIISNPQEAAALKQAGHLAKTLPASVERWLFRINQLGSANFTPLLVAGMSHYQNGKLDDAKLTSLLVAVERYQFIVFGLGERAAHTDRNVYQRRARDFYYNHELLTEIVKEINNSVAARYSTDLFIANISSRNLPDRDMCGFYGWTEITYLLNCYESCLHATIHNREQIPKIQWNMDSSVRLQDSVEHIYPQNPNEIDWKAFGGLCDQQKLTLQNTLGNLLLISRAKNASLQNDSFIKKSRDGDTCYRNGSFSEIQIVNDYEDWTPATIYARTSSLLEFIGMYWDVPDWNTAKKRALSILDFAKPNTQSCESV